MCGLCTIVFHNEIEFLVASFNLGEVKVEPFVTSLNRFASPIEVNRLGTSIVNNFFLLIDFGSNSNLLVRCHFQVNIIQSKFAKLCERYITRILEHLLENWFALSILCKVKRSRQSPDFMPFSHNVVIHSAITCRWNRQLKCTNPWEVDNRRSR